MIPLMISTTPLFPRTARSLHMCSTAVVSNLGDRRTLVHPQTSLVTAVSGS